MRYIDNTRERERPRAIYIDIHRARDNDICRPRERDRGREAERERPSERERSAYRECTHNPAIIPPFIGVHCHIYLAVLVMFTACVHSFRSPPFVQPGPLPPKCLFSNHVFACVGPPWKDCVVQSRQDNSRHISSTASCLYPPCALKQCDSQAFACSSAGVQFRSEAIRQALSRHGLFLRVPVGVRCCFARVLDKLSGFLLGGCSR